MLNFCKQKVLQILSYCFPNNYFGKFLDIQISRSFCLQNVSHGFLVSLQIVDILITKSGLNSFKQL